MEKNETELFIENCNYLGLKYLGQHYKQVIDQANSSGIGLWEFITTLIRNETDQRKERSIKYRIKESRLPKPYKLLSDFDFPFQPKLKKRLIMDLAEINFIPQNQSVLFVGNPGTGKSHLAQSLALLACQKRFRVLYTTCSEMIQDLNTGVYEKTLIKRLGKYVNPELLVIDEMGHDRLELEITKEAHLLFKVIDQRYKQNKSLIFTTNVEQQDWAGFLGDPISTRAILDRIFHRSIRVDIYGKSYREYEGNKLQEQYQNK